MGAALVRMDSPMSAECETCDGTGLVYLDNPERSPRVHRGRDVSTTIVLEPPCDFLNANDSLHFQAKGKLTKQWRRAAELAVNALFEPYHYTRARVICTIRFPDNRRRDVGNWYPTAKACLDGIVDSQLLLFDDSDKYVVGPDMRREYPNGPARVTVTITPLEQP
jgi:hypothetical protein